MSYRRKKRETDEEDHAEDGYGQGNYTQGYNDTQGYNYTQGYDNQGYNNNYYSSDYNSIYIQNGNYLLAVAEVEVMACELDSTYSSSGDNSESSGESQSSGESSGDYTRKKRDLKSFSLNENASKETFTDDIFTDFFSKKRSSHQRNIVGFQTPQNASCVRKIYPRTVVNQARIVKQVTTELITPSDYENLIGVQEYKINLRLVNSGVCRDKMSGRIEVQFINSTLDIPIYPFSDLEEKKAYEFGTIDDNSLDDFTGDYLCKSLFGEGAQVKELLKNSVCGVSESRVWRFACDDSNVAFKHGFNYPFGCGKWSEGRKDVDIGPLGGCSFDGCELDSNVDQYYDMMSTVGAVSENQQHAAISCECADGYAYEEITSMCELV